MSDAYHAMDTMVYVTASAATMGRYRTAGLLGFTSDRHRHERDMRALGPRRERALRRARAKRGEER